MKINSLVAIVPASGLGTRSYNIYSKFNIIPKQYRYIAGKPMIFHTVKSLLKDLRIDYVLVVVSSNDKFIDEALIGLDRVLIRRCGGNTRFETVKNALDSLSLFDDDWIIVHDAVRPGLPLSCLMQLIDVCLRDNNSGGLLALPISNTVKKCKLDAIVSTIDRSNLWLAQTPQMFKYGMLCRAMELVIRSGLSTTDESSAIELLGFSPLLVRGSIYNLKVTWPEDFEIIEKIL